jgi:RimJ/RimL family protein N-acetyltransferase
VLAVGRGELTSRGNSDAAARLAGYHPGVAHTYPPLNVEVRTPRLTLAGASDELLERLVPLVRAGVADAEPWPFDDPISFYADSPEREWQWLRGIWAGRGRVSPDSWRLYFAVLVDGEAVGMQDLTGRNFTRFGTVSSFSWLAPGRRGQGLGKEMRAAILHLAFAGLGAREAGSGAFVDNEASNRVSRGLGYEPNGTDWDTRRGEPARIQRWQLTRDGWERVRRDDIELTGVEECLPVLGIG